MSIYYDQIANLPDRHSYHVYILMESQQFSVLQSNRKLTYPARPSRTATTTVAQTPVPQARVAPAYKQLKQQKTSFPTQVETP